MKLLKLLKEIIAIELSKTPLGDDIHYIIESKEKLDTFSNTALEHLIKLEIIKDSRYRKDWLDTIKKSFLNMNKSSWVISKREKNKKQLNNILLEKLKSFDDYYKNARVDFNDKLIKNQTQFPKQYTYEQHTSIIAKWKLCADKFSNGDLDFFSQLNDFLE